MKINLGQIATGAMRQYLEDDTARIKTEEERRKARKLHGRRMLEIGEQARLRDKNAIAAEKRKATVDYSDINANYPFESQHWAFAKQAGVRKFEFNMKSAGLRSKTDFARRKLSYLEEVAGQIRENRNTFDANPEFIAEIYQQALRESRGGNLGDERYVDGKKIPGVLRLESFPNLMSLGEEYMGKDDKVGNAYSRFSNYLNPSIVLEESMPNKITQKIINKRRKDSNILAKNHPRGHLPPDILRTTENYILHSTPQGGNWLNNEHMLVGSQSYGSEGYTMGAEELVKTMLNDKTFPPHLRKGTSVRGERSTIQQLDFITNIVSYSSNYPYTEAGRSGLHFYDRNVISKEAKDEAIKQRRFISDAKKVVNSADRLIQLNQKMQDVSTTVGAPNARSALLNQWARQSYSTIKPLLDLWSSDSDRETIRKSGKLGELFTDERLTREGITDPKLRETIRESITSADANIAAMDKEIGNDIIQSQIEYAHLKVILTFTLAKLVQGGTGGRGVSNQDFEAVAKSLRDGSLTTLPQEITAFSAVLRSAMQEYVKLSFTQFPSIKVGSNKTNEMEDKVMNIYSALQQQHRQRRRLEGRDDDDDEGIGMREGEERDR